MAVPLSAYEGVHVLAAIIESCDDAIISKDLNGIVTSWNPAAERIFGYSAEEMIGRPIAILAAPDRFYEMPQILERIRRGERVEHYETVRRHRNGQLIDISLTVSPIRDSTGNIIGASKIARDITERKLIEQQLALEAERLARSNADLQQFAYVTSHDLQEPLRTIMGFTELIQQRYRGKLLDQTADDLMNHVVSAASQMEAFIQDLLTYSKVVNAETAMAPADTGQAVQWALNNLQMAIQESGIRIDIGEMPVVMGDFVTLVQLFQNLLSNAIKYRRSEEPWVQIMATRAGSEYVFTVKDNGIGIAPTYHERIFELFKRLHTRTESPGTGIGLTLCKEIVEKHGGRIWVESEVGQGAAFHFTLPAGR